MHRSSTGGIKPVFRHQQLGHWRPEDRMIDRWIKMWNLQFRMWNLCLPSSKRKDTSTVWHHHQHRGERNFIFSFTFKNQSDTYTGAHACSTASRSAVLILRPVSDTPTLVTTWVWNRCYELKTLSLWVIRLVSEKETLNKGVWEKGAILEHHWPLLGLGELLARFKSQTVRS